MGNGKRKKKRYQVGDVFLIPSSGGGYYVGQVAVDTKAEIGAPFCYLFDKDVSKEDDFEKLDLSASKIISAAFITPELIEHSHWEIFANKPVSVHSALSDVTAFRNKNFIGAVIRGASLVAEYLDTYYGVISESVWPDPDYVLKFFMRPRPQAKPH